MSKYILCQGCHAIGELSQDEMLYDHTCSICKGKLLLVHPDDFWLLEYHSDCQHMPGIWNNSYTEDRKKTTCIKHAGEFPEVRIIQDKHPCQKCRWHGTYCPDKDKSTIRIIGGKQQTLKGTQA